MSQERWIPVKHEPTAVLPTWYEAYKEGNNFYPLRDRFSGY